MRIRIRVRDERAPVRITLMEMVSLAIISMTTYESSDALHILSPMKLVVGIYVLALCDSIYIRVFRISKSYSPLHLTRLSIT